MSRNPYANQQTQSPYTATDWIGGVGSGALSGAGAGMAFGPYGAVIGGIAGGAMGLAGTAMNADKAKSAQAQQDALNRDLQSKDNLNRYMQQQGLSDALGRQSTRLDARQAAARGNLTGGAAAQLDLQAQNQIAMQQSQARPGMFLAAQQAEMQRQQQVMNNYLGAQQLASANQPVDMGQAFGALGQAAALYGTMKQGQKPVDTRGRNVSPDMMGQGQAALQADYSAEAAAAGARQAADLQWQQEVSNPWGQGYPAPGVTFDAPLAPAQIAPQSPQNAAPVRVGSAPANPPNRAPTPVSAPAIPAPPPGVPGYPNMEAWDPKRVTGESQPTHQQVTIPGVSQPLNVSNETVKAAEEKDAEALLQEPRWESAQTAIEGYQPKPKGVATLDFKPSMPTVDAPMQQNVPDGPVNPNWNLPPGTWPPRTDRGDTPIGPTAPAPVPREMVNFTPQPTQPTYLDNLYAQQQFYPNPPAQVVAPTPSTVNVPSAEGVAFLQQHAAAQNAAKQKAYEDFQAEYRLWLGSNPGGTMQQFQGTF